jgi:tRNA(fMet)-specific endonuclease VapC
LKLPLLLITYEEQVRGRLDVLSRAKRPEEQVIAYQNLQQLVINYRSIIIIPFSDVAAQENQRLRKAYPRLGKMDLKIAAISLTNNAILLTHNASDFGEIVELKIEDWSN